MTNDEKLNRAARAQAILNDPLVKEAMEHMEAECWQLFKKLAPSDSEGIMQVKAMQYFHGKYIAFFEKTMNDGKLAKLELERKPVRPTGY
jgi:hypothetical protein